MAWQTIAASETDANSPLNQTLMDKIRENLDDLHAAGASLKYLKATGVPSGTSPTFVLDDVINWRDRFIRIQGLVVTTTSANVGKWLPGGDNDEFIHSQLATHGTKPASPADWKLLEGFFYSQDGSNAFNNEPYLVFSGENGPVTFYVFVDDGTGGHAGALLLKCVSASSPNNYGAWDLLVVYSDDQGGY